MVFTNSRSWRAIFQSSVGLSSHLTKNTGNTKSLKLSSSFFPSCVIDDSLDIRSTNLLSHVDSLGRCCT